MKIISSEITENNLQADGTRYVSYRYTCDDGNTIYLYSMQKPGDYNIKAGLITHGAMAEALIVERKNHVDIEEDRIIEVS